VDDLKRSGGECRLSACKDYGSGEDPRFAAPTPLCASRAKRFFRRLGFPHKSTILLIGLIQFNVIPAQCQIHSHILVPNEAVLHRICPPIIIRELPSKIKEQASLLLSESSNLFIGKNNIVESKDSCSAFVWHESKTLSQALAPWENLIIYATVIHGDVTYGASNRQRPVVNSEIQRGIISGVYRPFELRVAHGDISRFSRWLSAFCWSDNISVIAKEKTYAQKYESSYAPVEAGPVVCISALLPSSNSNGEKNARNEQDDSKKKDAHSITLPKTALLLWSVGCFLFGAMVSFLIVAMLSGRRFPHN
jgi:hypothetical protein